MLNKYFIPCGRYVCKCKNNYKIISSSFYINCYKTYEDNKVLEELCKRRNITMEENKVYEEICRLENRL